MIATCPEVRELQRLLRGELAAEPSDACLGHVEQCPACSEAVEGLFAADPVIAAVRRAPAQNTPEPAPVLDLIRRLSALRTSATTSLDGATPVPGAPVTDEVVAVLGPAQSPDELGRLGGYRVLKRLGAGGMGVVFLAEDVALRRQVALKVMRPALANNDSARKRFLREARAVAAVEHENIVAIHQVGEEGGVPYLAMPLLKGTSLEERLRAGGALPPAEVLRLGRQIASGLSAAHERGLVHRDVKPGNIWIEPDSGRAKLLDFGLARGMVPDHAAEEEPLTELGTIIGTPAYLAPEQARGQVVDGRADLFSLGCVLYRMCTGRQPFAGDDPVALILSIATETPPSPASIDPSIPRSLSELIMQLLAKDPKKRPTSAAYVALRLAALEGAAPARHGRRTWWTVAAAALLLAVVGTVAAEIVIRIKDKNGKVVAEVKVPEGGSAETLERGRDAGSEESRAPFAPTTLMNYAAKVGDRLTFRVTGTTTGGTVWGTGPYTLDSNLARAAVHAGAVKAGQTGLVTFEIVAPPSAFGGSTANEVATEPWGTFPAGAFTVTKGGGGRVETTLESLTISKTAGGTTPREGEPILGGPGALTDPGSLSDYGDRKGKRLTFRVTGDPSGVVWGSGPYTLDSSFAAAAVHAGVVKAGETGTVTVEIIASPDSYTGTAANGVTSLAYGEWPAGAFRFVK
jgi:tRNA A-37 threonylcarbamoyl transferase component Bud32